MCRKMRPEQLKVQCTAGKHLQNASTEQSTPKLPTAPLLIQITCLKFRGASRPA